METEKLRAMNFVSESGRSGRNYMGRMEGLLFDHRASSIFICRGESPAEKKLRIRGAGG